MNAAPSANSPAPKAEVVTITFKLFQYVDGNGRDVFRLQYRNCFGLWCWVQWSGVDTLYSYSNAWQTPYRSSALQRAKELADKKRKQIADSLFYKRATSLRLVVIEEIKA